jgi:peptidoglycan/LPS O-acetylase OafA/YrhL
VGVLAYVVYYGVNATTLLARVLSSAPAVAMGAWSYSIFSMARARALRCHGDVFSVWSSDRDSGRHYRRLLTLASMLTVVCLSALTFNCFEVPARRLIGRTLLHTERSMDTTIAACVQTARLRVFRGLLLWAEEFHLYHRKDGLLVKRK